MRVRTKRNGRPLQRLDNSIQNRLTTSQNKTRDWRDRKLLEKIKQEQSELRPSPGISKGSVRLLAQKATSSPIYSNERIHQINTLKRRNLEKIKRLAVSPREEQRQFERPRLSPNAQSAFTSRAPSGSRTPREETTEEKELRKRCTFMPRTDKKSREIFERRNANNKSVEDRLLTYRLVQEQLMNELIKENTPSFTPNISKRYKRSNKVMRGDSVDGS
eukprot:TRINITY_DN10584_c0_g2_i1.p1 TRINITY_DN10584_c0_g2~~TRINITY_DN10584_c0_g2_i1.p1  ORF type:complete len:218 (-),score=52.14 TRINITY_DN10584_c0_g2_i1:322-975(-)